MAIADFEEIRSIAFGAISGTYAAVGSATASPSRGICVTNDTDGSMMITNDTTKDKMFVKSGSFRLWDIQSNQSEADEPYVFPTGTQWYVKEVEAPTEGSVYIENLIEA